MDSSIIIDETQIVLAKMMENHPELVREYTELIEKSKSQNCPASKPSHTYREHANQLYKAMKFFEASRLYSMSVRAAAECTEEIALAYANRSAVNFECGKYQLAVQDIDFALQDGMYPLKFTAKLLCRKATCLWKLDVSHEAQQIAKRALECLAHCDDGPSRESERLKIEQLLSKIQCSLNERKADPTSSYPIVVPSKSTEPPAHTLLRKHHAELKEASHEVCMKESLSKGRYLVARSLIPSGSLIIQEEPYAFVLLPDYWSTKCYHCLVDCEAPVYCQRRCDVQYCSYVCAGSSWSAYHQYECEHLPIIVRTGIGHLAYRIVSVAGELRQLGNGRIPPGDVYSDTYATVCALVTNSQHILPADMHHYAKTALLLLTCLRNTQFFAVCASSHQEVTELYVGSLLLHHIQQLICNAHAITALTVTPSCHSNMFDQCQNKVATAIYPTASLMNHSCQPNIIASFVGKTLFVKAQRDIEAGEEIFNCYGPHYLDMSKQERQQALKSQYYFDCNCSACEAEGSRFPLKALECVLCKGPAVIHHDSTAKCHLCKTEYDASQQLLNVFIIQQSVQQAHEHPDAHKGIRLAERALQMSSGVVYQQSKDMACIHDCIAKLSAATGDMKRCVAELRKSTVILESLYGKDSVELANDYHKLAEALCNSGDFTDAHNYACQARDILLKHYASNHSSITELNALCDNMQAVLLQ